MSALPRSTGDGGNFMMPREVESSAHRASQQLVSMPVDGPQPGNNRRAEDELGGLQLSLETSVDSTTSSGLLPYGIPGAIPDGRGIRGNFVV